jgi:hypothetical protein
MIDERKELAKQLFVRRVTQQAKQRADSPTPIDSVGNIAIESIHHANRFLITYEKFTEAADDYSKSLKEEP